MKEIKNRIMKTNKITKTILFSIITITFLLLSGCDTSKTSSPIGEYRTGTQGLELKYTTNAPPTIIYAEDQTFPVTVEIRNRGVYPGEGDGTLNAKLYYMGFDNQIITDLTQETITFQEEEAKTRFNPEGGFYIVNSEAKISQTLFDQSRIDSYNANIIAMLCYPYKTYATVDVCIDPNPNRESQLGTCTPRLVNADSQGAPISVSSVESISQRGKARFVITITNVGGGEVIRKSVLDRCADVELSKTEFDKITLVRATLSSGMPVECTPSGDVSLINGRATLVCTAEGLDESMPAFNTLLQLEIEYGYRKSIQRTIQIQGD
jgi:hypothetical protein